MWFYTLHLFILLLFQHFVLNETLPFFFARRLTKQAEFVLNSSQLKKSETIFVLTYSNGTKIPNYHAYNVNGDDDKRFQFVLQSSTLSHPVTLENNTFTFNKNHIGCKVFFKMTAYIRLNFTGEIGFKVRFNESKDNIVACCAFPLFHEDVHNSYHNCQLTEYFEVFLRKSKMTQKYERFVKILFENHFTISNDDEIQLFPILLSFSFVFPHQTDIFVGEHTKVLIKC